MGKKKEKKEVEKDVMEPEVVDIEEPNTVMSILQHPYVRGFIWGVLIVLFAWGVFLLGAYKSCDATEGLLVNPLSFWDVGCVHVEVQEACYEGGNMYLVPEYNNIDK